MVGGRLTCKKRSRFCLLRCSRWSGRRHGRSSRLHRSTPDWGGAQNTCGGSTNLVRLVAMPSTKKFWKSRKDFPGPFGLKAPGEVVTKAQYVRRLLATEDNFSVPPLGDDIDLVPMGLPGPMPQTLEEVYAEDDE